jgi:hypothetical protein
MTAGRIGNGGNMYSIPLSDHGIDIASTNIALSSGKGDTKCGSLLLEKVANMSISGVPQVEKTCARR